MIKIANKTRDRLEAGELALGVGLRQARTVDIGKAMKAAGFDWLFIDMEHNTMSLDDATNISIAAQDAGITPMVRVPGVEHHHALAALGAVQGGGEAGEAAADDADVGLNRSRQRRPVLHAHSRSSIVGRRVLTRLIVLVQQAVSGHGVIPLPLRRSAAGAGVPRG